MPTDDTMMVYNYDKHLYILDVEHVKNSLGIDFVDLEGSLTKAKDKLYQISRTIYNFIYKHTHYRNYMEYRLALDEDLRDTIQQALEEQCRYEVEMSAEYLSKQSGVNLINGMQIPLDRFRGEARISPDAHDLLRSKGLLYGGQIARMPMTYDYEEMGY